MRFFTSLAVVAAPLFAVLIACSSSSDDDANGSTPAGNCVTDPFTCAVGTTCAVKDQAGALDCLTSGAGAKGSPCQNTVGTTTCGDTLVCLQLSAAGGQCTPYCDPTAAAGSAQACATGETCQTAVLSGTPTTFHVCAGGTPAADAGHD
jgi:hypothetical protein